MTPGLPVDRSATACDAGVAWRPVVAAHGFSWRKRALVRDFAGRPDVRFVSRGADVPEGADLLLWGSAAVPVGMPGDVRVVRLEDGFLRSVGLGADLIRPVSWVVDTLGIYYDARTPNDLESLLQTASISPSLVERAKAFRQQVVQSGLSKYNLSGALWQRPDVRGQVVLVVGQVESDASIATGALDVRTNMALLQTVRQTRPDAWVVYKPHPDVVAGLRRSGAREDRAGQWADEVLTQGSPAQLFPLVDEVHVMTSLTGFEALLRHKAVFCYGQPFYAGWGLTQDIHPHPRRTRRLTLDELVAGALLLYPVYVGGQSRRRCTPEQALLELVAWRGQTQGQLPWWRRLLRPLLARP
ncbi:capsular polysaccharide biosynthesis protein [Polaromonas sp. JS666]|uniref:capsular polysaccharide export protein, LipB/KpsS family n=1 Tax=Polaromonas sp. (strain JS666 / ATCC BAA-500) TaxID=296591 RepID=UPI0000464378|nr:capsular polysaccharide biosynthesis protein [Polaromonas sp. JS666]ABE46797.1 Capsule polysaccharide biosynthesis [Polaromonas sp. JS666]